MLRYHTYIIVILPHIVSQPHLHSLSHKRCRQSTLLSAGGTSTSFGAILIIAPVPFAHPCLPARCQPIGRDELGVDPHAARACGLSMALRLDPLRLLPQSPFRNRRLFIRGAGGSPTASPRPSARHRG